MKIMTLFYLNLHSAVLYQCQECLDKLDCGWLVNNKNILVVKCSAQSDAAVS